jgi:lipoprotein-releasing system permease protein
MFTKIMAFKYLRGRKKFFFSFSVMLSLFGIIIGVFSLLTVSSVMNGFDKDMRSRVIGSKAEIRIYEKGFNPIENHALISEKIEKMRSIVGTAPVCKNELMLQHDNNITGTVCFGIDMKKQEKITGIFDNIRIGFPTERSLSDNGIILGFDQALSLGVTVGEYVQITSPLGTEPSPFGLLPKTKKTKVIGIFSSGMPEFDRVFSYISLQNGRFFADYQDRISYLEVKTVNAERSKKTAAEIQAVLGEDFITEDWSEFEASLFNSIKLEKIVMFFVLALMILISAFNITGNFVKLAAEKKQEIGILKAMGAKDKDIISIFVISGIILGICGAFFGTFSALALLISQKVFQFIKIPVQGFPLNTVPVDLRWIDFVLVPVITIIISFAAALKPAAKTAKILPVKTIRSR